jgi:hypothetical protein
VGAHTCLLLDEVLHSIATGRRCHLGIFGLQFLGLTGLNLLASHLHLVYHIISGLCEGLTLRQCGTIGAIVAGKVIEVVGTTFSEEAWQHAFQLVEKVRSEKYLF